MIERSNLARDGFDEKLAAALIDLPVPAGLEERMMARLAEDHPPKPVIGNVDTDNRIPRRRWLAFAGALAASVAVAVGISVWPRSETGFTLAQVLDMAPAWLEQLQARDAWQSPQRLPQDLPPSRSVNAGIVQWRDAARLVGRSAVAYALDSASGKRGTLLVIAQPKRIASATPPSTPQGTTLGLMVGCWQQGDLVYVLLVEGRERDYREFFAPGTRPSVT